MNQVYSTEETRIGTWINGKPLYRRVIQCKTPPEMLKWTTVISNLDGWDVMLIPKFCLNKVASIFGEMQFRIKTSGTEIQIYLTAGWVNNDATIVFEYTKKADVALQTNFEEAVDMLQTSIEESIAMKEVSISSASSAKKEMLVINPTDQGELM